MEGSEEEGGGERVGGAAQLAAAEARHGTAGAKTARATQPAKRKRSVAKGGSGGSRGGSKARSREAAGGEKPQRKAAEARDGKAEARGGKAAAREVAFERILSRRIRAGRLEYLIKWRDSRGGAATWEPAHHIHDPATVADFEYGSDRASRYTDWVWVHEPHLGWQCRPLHCEVGGCEVGGGGGGGGDAAEAEAGTEAGAEAEAEAGAGAEGTPARPGDEQKGKASAGGEEASEGGGSGLPEGWPACVTYTPFLVWGSGALAALRLKTCRPTPLPNVAIRPLPRSHPAFLPALTNVGAGTRERDHGESARGLFARCDIPASTYVGDFAGLVKLQQPSDPSKFLLELHREPGAADGTAEAFDIDAQHFGNEMRFINDYQLVAADPNVCFVLCRKPLSGELAVAVITARKICIGEELLVDYGRKFWSTPVLTPEAAAAASPSPLRLGPPAREAAAAAACENGAASFFRSGEAMAMAMAEGGVEGGGEVGLQRHSRRSPRLQADAAAAAVDADESGSGEGGEGGEGGEVTDDHAAISHEVVFGREVAGEAEGEMEGEAAGEGVLVAAEVSGAEPKRQRCSEKGRADSRQHEPLQLCDVPHVKVVAC